MDRNVFSEILFEEMNEELYNDEDLKKIASKKIQRSNKVLYSN